MKAIIRKKAGKNFSSMQVEQIAPAPLNSDEIRVRMHSARINPVDMDLMKGFPSLKYKNPQIGGIDGAGEVMEIGAEVERFKIGDAIFFYRLFSDIGTWAEEIVIKAAYCAKLSSNINIKDAGAMALPLLTAYDSIQQLNSKAGDTILIHGIAGGVGFQALQVAKALGLKVIGTASDRDAEILNQAGIDRMINYKEENFHEVLKPGEVDFIFDTLGGATLSQSISLKPKRLVSLHYVDPANMHKAGVQLPGFMKWLMNIMMGKFRRQAQSHHVQLIGQVTGANGPLLQEAVYLIKDSYLQRDQRSLTLSEVEANGTK